MLNIFNINNIFNLILITGFGHGLKLPKPQYLQFWIPPAPQPNQLSIGGVEEHSGS